MSYPEINFYLIRHGQSIRNTQKDLIGQYPDTKLSVNGKHQANQLAKYLHEFGFSNPNGIYCSTYTRAIETCSACYNSRVYGPINYDERLIEYNAGDMLDKSRKEILTPEMLIKINNEGMDFKYPNGESLFEVERRASEWLNECLDKYKNFNEKVNIMVFSHGMTIKCLLHHVMQFDHKLAWRMDIYNASISHIQYKCGEWFVKSINDSSFQNFIE